jgi:hypothetical protein
MNECKKTENGKNQQPCETMMEAMSFGLFEQQVFTMRSKNISRVAIVTKKYKGKYACVSFCPFCGVDVDTQDYGIKA